MRNQATATLSQGTLGAVPIAVTVAAKERKRSFGTLDGLRGVAAVLVVGGHALNGRVAAHLPGFYLAVDLFFVLSGFVLAHAYQDRLRERLSAGEFMLLRLIRLYPLYLCGTLLVLALAATRPVAGHGAGSSWSAVVSALAFMPDPQPGASSPYFYPLDPPAWSLFWELAVNLGFALVAPRLGRSLLVALLVVGLGLLLATAATFGSLDAGALTAKALGGGGRVVYSFVAGIVVYRVQQSGAVPWLRLPSWLALAAVCVLLAIPAMHWRMAYDLGVTVALFPALVLAASRGEPEAALRWPCAALGAASYAVYATHVGLRDGLDLASRHFFHHGYAAFGVPGTILFVIAAIVFAIAFDHL